MKLSERLVKLRELRGLTQIKLANKADISSRAIQYYENDARQPKGENILKLAKALDVPESALLSDEGFTTFLANQSTSGIRETISHNLTNGNKRMKRAITIGSGVPLLLNALTMPISIGLIGVSTITSIYGSVNKIQYYNGIKLIYKELSRIEALVVLINDKIEVLREDYDYLTNKTQNDEADIDEYKKILEISQILSMYQEYRSLLRQKSKYCSLLLSEIETNHKKETEILKKIIAEINRFELRERKYAEIITNNNNETMSTNSNEEK